MKIEIFVVGMMETNCYLVSNEETKEAVLIDPGDSPRTMIDAIESEGLSLQAILLTHAHFDHIGGLKEIVKAYPVPVYVYEKDQDMMKDPDLNVSRSYIKGGFSFDEALSVTDGEVLSLAGYDFLVLYTPGHTIGSCCYYVESEGVLFSGDTLFQLSVGRTDFPTGSTLDLMTSVKEKLFVLPEETHVYPGHMGETQIGYEKAHNPYVRP